MLIDPDPCPMPSLNIYFWWFCIKLYFDNPILSAERAKRLSTKLAKQIVVIFANITNKLSSDYKLLIYFKMKTIHRGNIFVKVKHFLAVKRKVEIEKADFCRFRWTKSVQRWDVSVVLKLLNLMTKPFYATETLRYKICEIAFLFSKFSPQIGFSRRKNCF